MKGVRKRFRYEWVLFASSVLFFLMSRFILPRYEEMMNTMNETEGNPWSPKFFTLSIILFVLFIVRVVWVIRQKKKS